MADPFTIESPTAAMTIVRVAEICSQKRTRSHEERLEEAVDSCSDKIVLDLTSTQVFTSEWFRFAYALTDRAARAGKRVILAGMSTTLSETADALALRGKLVAVATLAEALKA